MKMKLLSRLGQSVIALLGVALLLFVMLRVIPGNPVAVLMGEHGDDAVIARMTEELGLDQPILTQFFRYIGDCLRGNFVIPDCLERAAVSGIHKFDHDHDADH